MFGNWKKSSRLVLWEGQRRAARQRSPEEVRERRRQKFSRWAVGSGTVLAISLIVYAGGGNWGPPFPFREGEIYSRDIRVKIDFTVVDEPATQLKREQAAAAVQPVLVHDPAPLRVLQRRLIELCLAARSGSLSRMHPETVRFWALTQDELKELGQLLQGSPEDFAAMLQITPTVLPGIPGQQVLATGALIKARQPIESEEDLQKRLETAFANLLTGGILEDKEKELPEPVKAAKKITIRHPDGGTNAEVLPEQVLKSKLIGNPPKDRGPIYLQFSRALKSERIAGKLYELVIGSEKRPSRLPATLLFDQEETRRAQIKAQQVVPAQLKEYKRGAPLVEQGKPITEQDLALLRDEHKAYVKSLTPMDHWRRWLSLLLVIGLLGGFVASYIRRFLPEVVESLPRLAGVCGLITAGLAGAVFFSLSPWYAIVVPLTITAMILAIAFDQPFALVVSFSMALITTLSLGTELSHLLILVSGLTVAVLFVGKVRTRLQLVQVGFYTGLTYAAMTAAVGLMTDQTWSLIGHDVLRRFFLGLVAGFFMSGGLPFIERAFGVVTDISLLELTNVSHPLLQELVRRAPGTYTHSMTVATLAESAAETIGANALLSRVGACFHDIGKMLKPHYFIENQVENRHEGLAPAMSTLIIVGHVKDGVELGREHKLPTAIIDFIQQHHGTTLVEYFYREAAKNLESNQANGDLEAAFRYPGPKPQSREVGVVMLADAVEGASRALDEPTPGSLRKLVHDILLKRLLDGQFDESCLTLTELRLIEDSLCKSLIALYHARVKYPEAKTAG